MKLLNLNTKENFHIMQTLKKRYFISSGQIKHGDIYNGERRFNLISSSISSLTKYGSVSDKKLINCDSLHNFAFLMI